MGVEVIGFTLPEFEKDLGAFIRRVTIDTAESALREEVGRGFDNQPVVVTDGVPRRDYHGVKLGGKIEFIARTQIGDAVIWALRELARISPRLTGRYVSSHTVLLNGTEIASGNLALALRNVKDGDRIQIVNPQPYARKLEGATASKKTGRARRRGTSRQARSGVYRVVLRALVQRYGRSMFFDFTYVKLSTGVKVWGASGGGKGRRRVQRDQVYPCLKFYVKPTGLPN